MKFLIVYATTDGQTRKIARFCADQCVAAGHAVEMLAAGDAGGLVLSRFDGVVLAGSVHAGGFQKSLAQFAKDNAVALNARPSLFLPVSLSAAGTDAKDWAGLTACVVAFEAETGWAPTQTAHVAGAFRFTEYDFFRAWAMRWIAAQKGEVMDADGDREYTDWPKLGTALATWIAAMNTVQDGLSGLS